MKKFKLMLVAFMAMIGVSATAAEPTKADIGIWKVQYADADHGIIIGFKNDAKATDVKELNFPATLDDTENHVPGIKIIQVGDGAHALSTQVQNAIETVDFSEATNLATVEASAFAGATALKTVTFGTAQTAIGASAFNGCILLNAVTFPEGSKLESIGNFAFGTTPSLTSISFENCSKLKVFTTTPFVPDGKKNTELKSITLNGETTAIGTALANLAALTTVNLSSTKLEGIETDAFANDAALTELTTPNTLKTIEGTPFSGCVKLATLTIDAKELTTLGTAATSLYGGATDADKAALKSLYITGDVKAAILNGILSDCTALTTVEIAKGKEIKDAATLTAAAITVAKNASITLGKLSAATTAAFITAGDGSTLTIEEIAVEQTKEIVSGKIATTVGAIGAVACSLDAFGKSATSLTFTGNIGAAFTKYTAANENLTSIDFGTVELKENQIPSEANGTTQATPLAITWTPADGKAVKFIAKTAFADEEKGAASKVTLTTSLAVGKLYGFSEANVYNVIFNSAATAVEIEVAHKNATNYYGSFCYAGVNFKIAKAQNNGKVMVYGAYVDQSDNTVYMDQLKVIGGYYYVPAGAPVIIKSTTGDKVKAEFNSEAGKNSMNYVKSSTDTQSEIQVADENTVATTEAAKGDNAGFTLLYLYPFKDFDLYWNTLIPSATVPAGTFYLRANTALMKSGARINVVWLDGSEEATAIQVVKKVAEADGAIYNLAGQKVNASYKGVVIKDGKKYIQK